MTVTAKICGINDSIAMQTAVECGASHVGLVFYPPSPRAVTPEQATGLAAIADGRAQRVGLFVDPEDATLEQVLDSVSLDLLQLHGAETPARVRAIRDRTGIAVMKVIRVAEADDIRHADAYFDVADWLMFDAKPPKEMKNALPGGNALPFDWTLLSGRNWPLPWMLAGGLTAENVAEAVRRTGARVVDTSSGVEDSPGRKSPEKIRAFLDAVAALR
jgi:phosphoribosylanthranilate isomerase